MLKLDIVPYGEASKRAKKDWWMEASWRVTTSYTEDSDLGRATKLYLQAIQNHFSAGNVGRLTRESHSGITPGVASAEPSLAVNVCIANASLVRIALRFVCNEIFDGTGERFQQLRSRTV